MSDKPSPPSSDPVEIPTLPPGPRLPGEFGVVDPLLNQRQIDDDLMQHASPFERVLYRRINGVSDSVFGPESRLNQSLGRLDKLDEVLKQFSMMGRQIGNLQLQIGTLLHEQRIRNDEDDSNWKMIRAQVSGIRADMQNLEVSFEALRKDYTSQLGRVEEDLREELEIIREDVQQLRGQVEEIEHKLTPSEKS